MTGIELIALERARQVSHEGWTPEHDDRHCMGEMADAAACYAYYTSHPDKSEAKMPALWPWDSKDWKPKDPIRDLVRAGALIAAEIDRWKRVKKL